MSAKSSNPHDPCMSMIHLIVVDSPIERILSIQVKNVDNKIPNKVFDIAAYVYEESIFNALPANKTGKGYSTYIIRKNDNKNS